MSRWSATDAADAADADPIDWGTADADARCLGSEYAWVEEIASFNERHLLSHEWIFGSKKEDVCCCAGCVSGRLCHPPSGLTSTSMGTLARKSSMVVVRAV